MSLPSHLFVSSVDGALYDTREPDHFQRAPLRTPYNCMFGRIDNVAQMKATLRAGEYAWPGGYPMYFITSDGGSLSFDSVRENLRSIMDSIANDYRDGWKVIACEINWEDGDLYCDHSGKRIESAYAEPEEDAA